MAQSQIIMSIQSQDLKNRSLLTNGSKLFLCEDDYILAGDFLKNIEQFITDILDHKSKHGEWPAVIVMTQEEAQEMFKDDNDSV